MNIETLRGQNFQAEWTDLSPEGRDIKFTCSLMYAAGGRLVPVISGMWKNWAAPEWLREDACEDMFQEYIKAIGEALDFRANNPSYTEEQEFTRIELYVRELRKAVSELWSSLKNY